MKQDQSTKNPNTRNKSLLNPKTLLWIFIGVPFFVALIMDLTDDNKSSNRKSQNTTNQIAFDSAKKLSFYTQKCEQAFINAEHIKNHTEHKIIQSKYYEIPPENPWHFQMDGSDIAITGTMRIRNGIMKAGHQMQENYFYCGIDRASGKINYLNSAGYAKDINKLGNEAITRRPISKTKAMAEFEKKQRLDAEKEYTSLLMANCRRFINATYPQATIKIWRGKTVSPRKNKHGNWVMAFSWEATNAFGVDVHNRTWCEYDKDSGKRVAYETETLGFEK